MAPRARSRRSAMAGRGSLVNSSTTRTGGKTGIIYSARIVPSRQPVLRYPSTAACGPHAASAGKALPDKSDLRRNSFARIRRRSKRVLRILYAFHYRVDMFGNPSPKYAHIVAQQCRQKYVAVLHIGLRCYTRKLTDSQLISPQLTKTEQMVKLIRHKAGSQPRAYRSIVCTSWRQSAPPPSNA